MRYELSKRQTKELANGKCLEIAIPAPADELEAPGEWARGVLDVPKATTVRYVDHCLIDVCPLKKSSGGLTKVLGTLARTDECLWTVSVDVVIVTLSARPHTRGRYPTNWPGKLILDDGTVMPPE